MEYCMSVKKKFYNDFCWFSLKEANIITNFVLKYLNYPSSRGRKSDDFGCFFLDEIVENILHLQALEGCDKITS